MSHYTNKMGDEWHFVQNNRLSIFNNLEVEEMTCCSILKRKYKSLRSVKSLSKCEYKQIPEEHQCFLC